MTTNHLLSASLFAELFQHNLVSPDGRIIANEQQLRNYSTFLIKQSKERVTSLYAERKNMVDDVEELLRLGIRTEDEEELLKKLINELDLKLEEDGFLSLKEPKKPRKRYLGPKEPKKSIFERKIEAELERVKILKRDLRKLDDWLEQISHLSSVSDQKEHLIDWKEYGIKYRQRTTNRMCDMENARTKLIKQHYKDYDVTLSSVLHRKLPKEKYLYRIFGTKENTPNGKRNNKDVSPKGQKSLDDKTAYKAKNEKDRESNIGVKVKEDFKDINTKTTGKIKVETDNKNKEDDTMSQEGKDVATKNDAIKIPGALEEEADEKKK